MTESQFSAETVFQVAAVVAFTMLALLLAGWLWRHAKRGWAALTHVAKAKTEPAIAESEPIRTSVRQISALLDEMEKDTSQAEKMLLDAQQYTATLVKLVRGIATKAEAMQADIDQLNAALEAIESQQPLSIARAAGQVRDEHLRDLLLANLTDAGYWQDVGRTVAAQVGTLSLWQRSYRQFVTNLLTEVSQVKTRLAASTAALELTAAGRPLLQVQAHLDESQTLLQIQRRPALARHARNLPAINAGLLR